MIAPLWVGTPYADFANQVWASETHRLAYFMSKADQTVFELFDIFPDGEPAPDEARQVAVIMMLLQTGQRDNASAMHEIGRLFTSWRERRSVN